MSRLKLLAGYKKGFRDDQNFQFPVLRERLLLKNGQDTKLDALYRGDTGAPLSVVSPKYVVTPHKEANDFIETMLTNEGINYEIGHTSIVKGGGRFLREFRFPDLAFTTGAINNTALDGGKLDQYVPTIIARNSYDRSSTLDFTYGGFRVVCSNGLVIGDILQRISIKHNVAPDYKKIANGFVMNMEKTIEGFKSNYNRLNSESANAYLNVLMLQTLSIRTAQVVEGLSKGLLTLEYDADGNVTGVVANPLLSAYALFQLATDACSHSVRKFHRSLQLLQKVSSVFGV